MPERHVPFLALVLSLLASACALGPNKNQALPPSAEPPAWVLRGSGRFEADGRLAFWGVGRAPAMKNGQIQADLAAQRARRLAQDALMIHLRADLKYGHCIQAPGEGAKPGCDLAAYRNLLQPDDIAIDARWNDPADGTICALARLDVARVIARLAAMPGLPAPLRQSIVAGLKQTDDRNAAPTE